MRNRLTATVLALAALTGALVAATTASARSADTRLSLIAYSTPREAYGKLIPLFQKTPAGEESPSASPTAPRVTRPGPSRQD